MDPWPSAQCACVRDHDTAVGASFHPCRSVRVVKTTNFHSCMIRQSARPMMMLDPYRPSSTKEWMILRGGADDDCFVNIVASFSVVKSRRPIEWTWKRKTRLACDAVLLHHKHTLLDPWGYWKYIQNVLVVVAVAAVEQCHDTKTSRKKTTMTMMIPRKTMKRMRLVPREHHHQDHPYDTEDDTAARRTCDLIDRVSDKMMTKGLPDICVVPQPTNCRAIEWPFEYRVFPGHPFRVVGVPCRDWLWLCGPFRHYWTETKRLGRLASACENDNVEKTKKMIDFYCDFDCFDCCCYWWTCSCS